MPHFFSALGFTDIGSSNSGFANLAGPNRVALGATVTPISEGTRVALYLVYALIAVGLVAWLGRTLYANGEDFLRNVFEDAEVAKAVNHLLVVGFYLLNLGFALMLYQISEFSMSLTTAVNDLVVNIGTLLLSLGVIHLVNMAVFWRIRTRNERKTYSSPLRNLPEPNDYLPPPPPAGPGVVAPA
ncbi:MAG: hypothetical protein R2733_14460 [Acidimicrobiales bacterium]